MELIVLRVPPWPDSATSAVPSNRLEWAARVRTCTYQVQALLQATAALAHSNGHKEVMRSVRWKKVRTHIRICRPAETSVPELAMVESGAKPLHSFAVRRPTCGAVMDGDLKKPSTPSSRS